MTFPEHFVWGAATSAYQVEGGAFENGKGPSIWDRFAHTPGKTKFGQTGDVACDHYHRCKDDVALMAELGLTSYRFSVSWSRVLPAGRGRRNQPGLDFYSKLVDELLAVGIAPNLTLYHWDLPVALDDAGGWLNPDIAGWFSDYAVLMARTLGDRVAFWATLNEPWVSMDAGYVHGVHAPGIADWRTAPRVAHNLLRAHATAVQALRAEVKQPLGIVVNLEPKYTASDAEEDRAAAQRADAYMNRFFLDPIFLGRYPDELFEMFDDAWLDQPAADFELIREPIDFLGINYYKRAVVRADSNALPTRASGVPQPDHLHTELGWEVYPSGLTRTLESVRDRYPPIPLYVTENGAAFADPPSATDGNVHDPLRIDYLREHLHAARAAIMSGVDLRGYYVWALLDNFEWAEGFTPRFGIVHVDFDTLTRTVKSSAHFYSDVVRSNGAAIDS